MTALWNRDPLDRRALVLVVADRDSSMWSQDVNDLVNDVEERIDAGCVTFALLNGRHPSLVDALTAARFSGCTSAVVAIVGDGAVPSVAALPRTRDEMPMTVALCGRSVQSIVNAFESAALAESAACA